VRRNLANITAGGDEELGEGPPEPAGAFEAHRSTGPWAVAHTSAAAWPSRLLAKWA
jgi:hypothetical protein